MHPRRISDLVFQLKEGIEKHFHQVFVEGEVSNLTRSSIGHWYFNISDERASMPVAMFRGDAQRCVALRKLKDGDRVHLLGPVSLYPKRGNLQLIAKQLSLKGSGGLKERLEELKRKLGQEGLFDIESKRQIPVHPRKVGVVTALGAAALQDFLKMLNIYHAPFEVVIAPCSVQGEKAPRQISHSIDRLEHHGVDLIVIMRGGGSFEDLFCFNDEALVRRIAMCEVPTVSAIGHEVDFTLCDHVADLRVPTPTAAGELLTGRIRDKLAELDGLKARMQAAIRTRFESKKNQLVSVDPTRQQKALWNYCSRMRSQLFRNAPDQVFRRRFDPGGMTRLLDECHPGRAFSRRFSTERLSYQLEETLQQMVTSTERRVERLGSNLNTMKKQLDALNPKNVLERGYAVVSHGQHVVTSAATVKELPEGSGIQIMFADGEADLQTPPREGV